MDQPTAVPKSSAPRAQPQPLTNRSHLGKPGYPPAGLQSQVPAALGPPACEPGRGDHCGRPFAARLCLRSRSDYSQVCKRASLDLSACLFLTSNPAVLSISGTGSSLLSGARATIDFPWNQARETQATVQVTEGCWLVLWEARADKSWVPGDPRREEQGPE